MEDNKHEYIPRSIEVNTPLGTLCAVVSDDEDYPGITIYLKRGEGETTEHLTLSIVECRSLFNPPDIQLVSYGLPMMDEPTYIAQNTPDQLNEWFNLNPTNPNKEGN